MQILYLGQDAELLAFMTQFDTVIQTEEKLLFEQCKNLGPDLIVSYNYRHILPKEILLIPALGTINLHIAYLPYNRGAHPNVWSHLEGSPTGVTIHQMDAGIDTGSIIAQKLVPISEDFSLSESWAILQKEIKALFKEYYQILRSGKYKVYSQKKGTFHLSRQLPQFKNGYETKIKELIPNEIG